MIRATLSEIKEGICEAVAQLDQCDGSRIGQMEAIDSARIILQTAYGDDLDQDVKDFIDAQEEASFNGNDLQDRLEEALALVNANKNDLDRLVESVIPSSDGRVKSARVVELEAAMAQIAAIVVAAFPPENEDLTSPP